MGKLRMCIGVEPNNESVYEQYVKITDTGTSVDLLYV